MTIDSQTTTLVHLPDKLVDIGLPITEIAALNKVPELARSPTASGVRKFKRPEEVGHLTARVIRIFAQFILWLQYWPV